MSELWNILTSVISGGLVVQVINWYLNRKLSKARRAGDIDATYIDNINMLRQELIKIQNENRKLYRAVARLDRTVAKATSCHHWDNCPVRHELQKSGTDDHHHIPPPKRQPAKRKRIRSDPSSRAAQCGTDEAADEPPCHTAPRSRLHLIKRHSKKL